MEIKELEEKVATLSALLGHQGWTDFVLPTVLHWQASGMNELLTDVGDKKGRNDFLRGQITAYKMVLKHFRDQLTDLQHKLDEARAGKPLDVDESANPPVI